MKRPQHHGAGSTRSGAPKSVSLPRRSSVNPTARVHRAEVREERRFTEGPRRQRRVRLTITASVLGFIAMVAGIVLSPLMTLTDIVISGRDTVPEEVVMGAVSDQIGTPLALIDYDAIASKLGSVVRVQSFSTELRPPHTLVVRIVERTPIGAVQSAEGWDVLDAAGVVMETTPTAPEFVPILDVDGVDSPGFAAAVKALNALPPKLRADVATISAATRDSVRFVLRGVTHEIRWGSDEQSTLKAAVLARALGIAKSKGGTYVIDVSAPDTLIMNRVK